MGRKKHEYVGMRWLFLLSVSVMCIVAQKPPASSGSSSASSSSASAPSSDTGASNSTSSASITATASNVKEGPLAGTAKAPLPNHSGKTGPDDHYFVDGAMSYSKPAWTLAITASSLLVYFVSDVHIG